jgi:two-component system, NtrC family, sensor kinase
MPADAALLETLRAKAMLLLRREKELFELRLDRSRTEAWLGVFHKTSLDLTGKTELGLFEEWTRAMVDDLKFQVSVVYRYEPAARRLTELCQRAHAPLPEHLPLEDETLAFLARNRTGLYGDKDRETLDPMAREAGLGKFLWSYFATRDRQLLLLAGFSAQADKFHPITEHDLDHYRLFAAHLVALLDNISLIGELNRERSELRGSNDQLDASLGELRETQTRLVHSSKVLAEVSRRAGMAEIATGVLHNVGNTLNSVNVSAEVAAKRVAGLKVGSVGRIADILEKNAGRLVAYLTEDAQGLELPAYLKRLGSNLVDERRSISEELELLRQHIEHIKWIVSKQQAYAKTMGLTEACFMNDLMDDAINLAGQALLDDNIQVVRDYQPPVPEALLDRHKVLQILVNLVSNAKHALSASPRIDRRMTARIAARETRIVVELADNGVGVAREHMDKLFSHGFTTKVGGHGFGLHTSALAAKEMGGALSCQSDGPGQGARFVLELPLRAPSTTIPEKTRAI